MTANEKKPAGFFLYPEHVRAACGMLSPADAGRLLLALCDYAQYGTLPESRRKAFLSCFALLQDDIDRDVERYREVCERNRERILRRWHRDPQQDNSYRGIPAYTYTTQHNPTQPNPTQPNPTQPSTTQPSTAQAGAAAAASGACLPSSVKGDHHDRAGNHRSGPRHRGTVL